MIENEKRRFQEMADAHKARFLPGGAVGGCRVKNYVVQVPGSVCSSVLKPKQNQNFHHLVVSSNSIRKAYEYKRVRYVARKIPYKIIIDGIPIHNSGTRAVSLSVNTVYTCI